MGKPCECNGGYPGDYVEEIWTGRDDSGQDVMRGIAIEMTGEQGENLSESEPCAIEFLRAVPPSPGRYGTTCGNCGRILDVVSRDYTVPLPTHE